MKVSWSLPPPPLIAGGLLALFHRFRRRARRRRRDSRAALVGVADMGRGSRGKGLSDSAPVRDRRHRLLGSAAGEHPGPAIGTQRKPPVSVKNFLEINTGGHVPAERLGEVRRPGLPVSRRLRPPRIHQGNHQGTHPGSRRSHPGHHRAQAASAQCRVQRPDLRRRRDASGRRQGQRLAGPDGLRGGRLEPHPDRSCRSKTKR